MRGSRVTAIMKIACDACEAKYSIADDKVRGKVFKIRCKKCSNVIVVRGVAEEVAPVPVAVPVDNVWHLVVAEDQIGPLTIEDVRARFAAGEIDGDTYAWREGLADWAPLSQVDELSALVQPAAVRDDLFAAAPAPVVEQTIVSDGGGQRLRGERNESSVLFSLGNLAQIATRPAPVPVRADATPVPGQEGSGLIDIRSMASAYLGAAPSGLAKASVGSIDDLPVFNTGSAFSEPAVLVPLPTRAAPSRMMYAMIAAIVAFAAVAIVLLVVLLKKSDPVSPPAATVAVVEPAPPPAPPPRVAAAAPAPAANADASNADAPKPAAAKPEAPKPEAPKLAARPKKDVVKVPAVLAPSPPAKLACDDVTCIVNADSPCCQKLRNAVPVKAKADKLDASMISTGLAGVSARVQQCGAAHPASGRVKLHVKVGADGKVSEASVESSPDDALGTCVASAVKHATFPATQSGGSFGKPYTF